MRDSFYRQIYNKYQLHPAYHMTHLENLPSIFENGLLSHNRINSGRYVNIANDDVQQGRAMITVGITGRPLHDYIPLYFGFKTPMVACNQAINEKLVFLRFSLDILARPGVVFTDGNARSRETSFFQFTGLDSLAVLDVRAIHSVKYAHDAESRRRKQAEILYPDHLALDQLIDIFVYSSRAQKEVLDMLMQHGRSLRVIIETGWYFR